MEVIYSQESQMNTQDLKSGVDVVNKGWRIVSMHRI
jgi:hypothetical protein